MVAMKFPPARADLEWRLPKACFDLKEWKPQKTLAGFIFVCSNDTVPDLERGIFGLPAYHKDSVRAIRRGMPLFLFNYNSRYLFGVFEAASDGGFNLDPNAWENTEVRSGFGSAPVSRYPAQVRMRLRFQRPPLDEETFRPVLDHFEGHKFRLELTAYQVQQLLKLFQVPEREFFGERSRKRINRTAIGIYDPESPRSAFKSDSDCYSECSSKGTYCGEDEWTDEAPSEDRMVRESTQLHLAHDNREHCLTESLSHMALNDEESNHHKVAKGSLGENMSYDTVSLPEMPFMPDESNSIDVNGLHTWKRNPVKISHHPWSETLDPRDENQMLSRLREVDLAVNSNPMGLIQAGVHQENIVKVKNSRHQKPQKPLDTQPQPPIQPQDLQFSQVLFPVCAQRPGPVFKQNHLTTILSPVFVSPHWQCLAFTQPQMGVVEETEEGNRSLNGTQLHSGGHQTLLQSGPFPIVFVPSRIPATPPPMAAGFVQALHFDILHFAKLTRPSLETQLYAIDCVRSCVKTLWPDADVEVFGSFATGLCLQHSDIDLAVVGAPLLPSLVNMSTPQASAFLIRELAPSLKSYEWCKSYNVLATASVPVLKCYYRPMVRLSDPSISVPTIAIDITIGGIKNSNYKWNQGYTKDAAGKGPKLCNLGTQHTGGAAREYVLSKIRELPALAPLVLLLKSFLQHKGLSNVYSGGLGSFSLTLLLAYYLERVPSPREVFTDGLLGDSPAFVKVSSPLSCMSELSEDFETPSTRSSCDDFYSSHKAEFSNWSLGEHYVRRAANVIEEILALWDSGGVPYLGILLLGFLRTFGFERNLACEKIVLKGIDGSPGGIFKRDSRHIALWIDDPLRPGVNVGAGSFAMWHVQGAFREMLQKILINQQLPASLLHCSEKSCRDLAAFGQLSQLSQSLVEANSYQ